MERITRLRVGILLLIIGLILGFYAFRLFNVQIIETNGDTDNITTFTTMTRVKAARGDILDRNGNVLVGNRASYDIIINHYVLTSSDDPNGHLYDLVKLCEELDIQYEDHFPVTMSRPFTYTLDQQNSAWQGYFQTYLSEQGALDSDITAPLLIKQLREDYDIPEEWSDEDARKVIGLRYELRLRGLTNLSTYVFLYDAQDTQLSAILETNVPGLNVEASTVREYSTGYAAHILGYVGPMSDEQWEYYSELGYSMDAEIGQSGLEQYFEEELHGTDGWRIDVVTSDGTIIESYYENGEPPKAGNNVEITIDLNIQEVAEDSLADAMHELVSQTSPTADGKDAEGAAVVVMEAKTGKVLAMGSYPTYDLRTFAEDYEEIINAAKQAHAHSFIKRLPQGYDTVVGEGGGQLSQGQKQLLCIARVMLCLPPMLFLDEATSSIDTRTEARIQKAFNTMMKGRTSFIVAHRLSTIQEADLILVMRDGQIIEQGRHQQLLEKRGFYAQLYQSQFAH